MPNEHAGYTLKVLFNCPEQRYSQYGLAARKRAMQKTFSQRAANTLPPTERLQFCTVRKSHIPARYVQATALAAEGAAVVVHYSASASEADAVVREIRSAGGNAEAVRADLADFDGPRKLALETTRIVGDRLDILFANAGIAKTATLEETTIEDFDRLFAVNVRAPFFLVQQLLPIMGNGSSVVLVSSLAAHAVVGTLPAYSATKGAIDTLVKHFAAALGERGVRVNAVAPGVVATDMSSFTKTDAGRDFALGIQALNTHVAEPADIAGVVAFLASEDARWITGDTVRVDGGSKL
jgi:3-oxoacyl-[acyl-carrier protein] reductase